MTGWIVFEVRGRDDEVNDALARVKANLEHLVGKPIDPSKPDGLRVSEVFVTTEPLPKIG